MKIFKSFSLWFFEKGDARVAGALRIAFGLIFLFILWDLQPLLDFLISQSTFVGFPPDSSLIQLIGFSISDKFFILHFWFWASVVFATLTTLGLFTRISVILSFLCLIFFQESFHAFTFGADKVLKACWVFLLFLETDRRWSIDQLFRRKMGKPKSTFIELWPVKGIQIQIALIYFFSAWAKLKNPVWLDGSALYYALQTPGLSWVNGTMLLSVKPLVIGLTYYALIAEFAFIFLVFGKKTRFLALGSVFLLHLGIDASMHLRFFSLCMYAGYLSFLKPTEWEWLAVKVKKILRSPLTQAYHA